MAIKINYNTYENIYATQKQEPVKHWAASKKEMSETAVAQKNSTAGNSKVKRTLDYAEKLKKLAPSVEFAIGNTHSSAKSGKTLTINPTLLEKMQDDPIKEKEMRELIRGVESATKLLDSMHRANGWKVVYRHGYIDENGKYSSCAYVRNDFMLNIGDKLREERKENSKKLLEKSKEESEKKKNELQDALGEKETEEETAKFKTIIDQKIASSQNGIIYMNNTDMKIIIEAAKKDKKEKVSGKEQIQAGANLNLKV